VCLDWFNLPAETSGQASRVSSLLRAVYTRVAWNEFTAKAKDPRDAEFIPFAADQMTGVTNELGEIGTEGGISFDDA
jgi:hypothetical protein